MNSKNLKTPSTEEARERGKKGGIASGKARAEKKRLKEAVESILSMKYDSGAGKKLTGYEMVATALFGRAKEGDVSAFNSIRDLIGEKPTDKINATINNTENQELLKRYLEEIKHGKSYRQEAED